MKVSQNVNIHLRFDFFLYFYRFKKKIEILKYDLLNSHVLTHIIFYNQSFVLAGVDSRLERSLA